MPTFERPVFDAITAWGMGFLALGMSLAWTRFAARQRPSYGYAFATFFIVLVGIAWLGDRSGVFARTDLLPSPFVLAVTASIGFGIAVGLGRMGSRLINHTDLQSLVALQIFRLPLELLMLRAALLGIMPVEFSLLGYNFDFLTGLGALLIVLFMTAGRQVPIKLLWAWNVLGIACLMAIGVLAALTSPIVHAFGTAAAHLNTWVLYFPYALLPLLLVSCAAFGHVLMTRKLLAVYSNSQ